MRTPNDVRIAMQDLARTAEPLSAAGVLQAAQRQRARRRWAGAAGTVTAVLAVTSGIAAVNLDRMPVNSIAAVSEEHDAHRQLERSVDGLREGNYAFTRSGARGLADVTRGEVHGDSYVVEYVGRQSTMRIDATTYLLPSGGLNARRTSYLARSRREGVSDAELRKLEGVFTELDGSRWLRVDAVRLTSAAASEQQSSLDQLAAAPSTDRPDITGVDALVNAVVTAEQSGHTITGTLDATRVDERLRLLEADFAYFGPQVRSLAYRATLDDAGRLSTLRVDQPDSPELAPAAPLAITISRYGQAQVPPAPIDAAELSSLGYDLLAGDED
ncbi:hypothetical protein [Actinoplanes sp. NPDC051859]|uniref:hypothetical protein n=1 Tax=Actinoplanes sp. NPDC051859 TaxID=3363909 RepID=UPI0037AA6102